MEQNAEVSGGATATEGSADDSKKEASQQTDSKANGNEEVKSVDYKDHKRALDDMLKYKRQTKEMQSKLADFEARFQSIQDEKLSAEGKKDELIESYKKRLTDAEQKAQSTVESFYESKKRDAIYAEANKHGIIDPDDIDRIDLDGVSVERTDQGRVIVHGANEVVENYRKKKPHWFQNKSVPKLSSGGATGVIEPSNLTAGYMRQLEKTDKQKFYKLFPEYVKQLKQK